MGSQTAFVIAGVLGLSVKLFYTFFIQAIEAPQLQEICWVTGACNETRDAKIIPFKIEIDDSILDDLQSRLQNYRPLTPQLEGIYQEYGINSNFLKDVVTFWRKKYNWRERQAFLNKYNQYVTKIQGLNIHYLHIKAKTSEKTKVVPIILLHGWPSSFTEFYEMLPLLTMPQENQKIVFEVIVPSLPGFGFSEGASKPGLGAIQTAVILKNLMKRLNFETFYVHGTGDFGSSIASNMAALYPQHVLGIHLNLCFVNTALSKMKTLIGALYPPMVVDEKHQHKLYPLLERLSTFIEEIGFAHIQATKPDTLGVSLNDSPVGLAAYILEKFSLWTNPDSKSLSRSGLEKKLTYIQLLDNIMIYWTSGSITTSLRMFAETYNAENCALKMNRVEVKPPSACANLEHAYLYQPEHILSEKYINLLQSSDIPNTGYFAGFENPKLLTEDIYSAVNKFEEFNKK